MPRKHRRLRDALRRDDGSLPLAILLAIIVTSLVMIVTATTVAKQNKTGDSRDFAIAQQAADAAVNDALMWVNSGHPTTWGNLTKPNTTTDEGATNSGLTGSVHWSWAVAPTPGSPSGARGVDGDIYHLRIITSNDPVPQNASVRRDFDVDLTRSQVQNADTATNKPRYRVASTDGAGFSAGFFANTQMLLGPRTNVTSYPTTGNGRISTNGVITLGCDDTPGNTSCADADRVTLYNANTLPYRDRCVGPSCATTPTQMDPVNYIVTADVVAQKCPASTVASTVASPWVASDMQGLTPGGCYASLTFDRARPDIIYNATDVYVLGDVTVSSGIDVNAAASPPVAANLRVYAAGQHITIDGGGSHVAWALWAPNADCSGGVQGDVNVYGAMLCDRLTTASTGTWNLRFDDRLRSLVSAAAVGVWSVSKYVER